MTDDEETALAAEAQESEALAVQPGQPDQLTISDRLGVLDKTTYISSRQPNFEESVYEKKRTIDRKFHFMGWDNDEDPDAWHEMFQELMTYLFELACHVGPDQFDRRKVEVINYIRWVMKQNSDLQIPLLYAKISSHLFQVKIGLKAPQDASIFDLDVDALFKGHLKRLRPDEKSEALVKEVTTK